MASNTGTDGFATNLAKAKAYYDEKQYPKASAIFKQVANSCPCGMQLRTSPCCCKSLVPAVTHGTLDAELRKKCICSAKSDARCKVSGHLDALDGLAAVYEARRLIDKAITIAEAMINLAPREPKGFLRLGRLLRLQRSFHPAFQTYQQGIELVSKKNPSHPLLSTLRQMRDKVRNLAVATDPFTVLPVELVAMVLRDVDFRSLCRCLRVSKSWKALLTTKDATIQALWRIQHFTHCTHAVRPGHLQKYTTYSGGQVTQLVIGDCRQFGMNWNVFRWIASSCRSLRVLKLRSPKEVSMPVSGSLGTVCVPRLTSLYLGTHAPFMAEFLYKIVASSAATLQELTVLNFPNESTLMIWAVGKADWPVLQRLRVLRLGGLPHSNRRAGIMLSSFMRSSPNVEEVWLEGLSVHLGDGLDLPSNPWPHLKKLFVGRSFDWGHYVDPPFRLPHDLEELHLMSSVHISWFLYPLFPQDPGMTTTAAKPIELNLRKLTLRDWGPETHDGQWPIDLEGWVRPGLESGAMTDLGMMCSKHHPPWLRSEHLKFLSVKGLSVTFGPDPFALDEALSSLLERFPNLEGLDIAQEPFSNTALAKAVRKGVRLIYHCGGYNQRTEVREWALENYNARIVEGDYVVQLPMYPTEDPFMKYY